MMNESEVLLFIVHRSSFSLHSLLLATFILQRMRLWLTKHSEVPLREQLTTQIVLGVVSHDLRPGQRLPSTRELARRFGIHANTVSAAYRELEARGWVESRQGSGVYVRGFGGDETAPAAFASSTPGARFALDQLISSFLKRAREDGHSLSDVQARIRHWLRLQPPDHFLVIEPDAELRAILVAEIAAAATDFRVLGAGIEECAAKGLPTGAAAVVLYGQVERVRPLLPPDSSRLLVLHSRSVPDALAQAERPAPDALVTVASRWPDFLRWARAVLIAAGLDQHALDFRDARLPDWQRGLRRGHFIITDALTAKQLPPTCDARVFPLIADHSLAELRAFVENFLT